ncbi:uncharacterized protein LOC107326567 isoform X2 [Python bivittatus]|uniref:Uncharacterized protein LOC107326567 isoform X2 n=1 Tax=Python bivittatus TaxID=176946 RepID=A0A9F5JBP3_PYTBI|nr:uncharacterized protein LOC107326567 isoform X2 [Python bivittatus]
MAVFVRTHLLGLCLFCIHLTRQETCNAPGSLTSPQLFLRSLSNDEVLLNCLIPRHSQFSRVIFCKDRKEMETKEQEDNTFSYTFHYKLSQDGAGQISCMFQFKDTKNQVKNSGLSNSKMFREVSDHEDSSPLPTTGDKVPSNLPSMKYNMHFVEVGITVGVILILAAGFCSLKKSGVIKQRETKDQHKSNAATEIKNQPNLCSLIPGNQSVNSFDEDYSHDNVLHSYEEVTSSQFHRTYSQGEKTQIALSPLYSIVSFKKKPHSVSGLCEEEL